ncbi:MAG: hypothetical protein O3A14_03285 [Cyanobacteria bacterium]|nr:hypothetical protein [Cyanobacteriota bacterium]
MKGLGLISLGLGAAIALTACQPAPNVPHRNIALHQEWLLQPGSQVSGYRVVGGLGDISIELGGRSAHAPFPGQVEPTDTDCIAFTSQEVPGYLFRLCGLRRPRLGPVEAGEVIGKGEILQFAAMRREPDGTWAMVEPAMDVLERTVSR